VHSSPSTPTNSPCSCQQINQQCPLPVHKYVTIRRQDLIIQNKAITENLRRTMHNRTTTAQMKKQKVALLTPCMKHSCAPLARQTGDQTPSSTSRSPFSVQIPQRRTKLTADKGMLPTALLITAGSVCIHTSWQKWLSEKKNHLLGIK